MNHFRFHWKLFSTCQQTILEQFQTVTNCSKSLQGSSTPLQPSQGRMHSFVNHRSPHIHQCCERAETANKKLSEWDVPFPVTSLYLTCTLMLTHEQEPWFRKGNTPHICLWDSQLHCRGDSIMLKELTLERKCQLAPHTEHPLLGGEKISLHLSMNDRMRKPHKIWYYMK